MFKTSYDCIPCAISSLITLFKKGLVPQEDQNKTMRTMLDYLSKTDFDQSPPLLGRGIHRKIREVLNNPDPYKEIKNKSNSLMLKYYPELKATVDRASVPFILAMRLAIAGNIIDYGPNNKFDIAATIKKAQSIQLAVDFSAQLKEELANANVVLYLGDNAGEIVMDRIFIETIQHKNLYFAVRGAPIINDVTMADAKAVGIDKIAHIISNGDDSPGTILDNTSNEFLSIFNKADLIISKGQGNYESLSDCEKKIFFLLLVKCDHLANHLNVKKGDFLVKSNLKKG